MIKIAGMVAAAAALLVGATAAVLPAGAADRPTTQTLVFASTQGPNDEHFIDAPPEGFSVGGRFLLSSMLRRDGRVGGRLEGDCVAVDQRFGALHCALVVLLPGGRLALEGAHTDRPAPGVGGTGEIYAITGGRAGTWTRRAR